MLTCIDFATLVLMLLVYLPHCCLWFCWTPYRPLHDHAGIGGLDHSLGEKIVKSMIKAGEITFGKLHQSPRLNNICNAFDYPSTKSTKNLTHGRPIIPSKQFFAWPMDKVGRNPFFLRGKTASTIASGFSYFNNNTKYPGYSTHSPTNSQKSDPDSLQSIDYEMLGFHKTVPGPSPHSGLINLKSVSPTGSLDDIICRPNIHSRNSRLSQHSSFGKPPIPSDSERDSGFCGNHSNHHDEMSPFPSRASRPFSVIDLTDLPPGVKRWGDGLIIEDRYSAPSLTVDTQDTTAGELTSIDEEDSYTTSLERLNKLKLNKLGIDNFNLMSY